MGSRIGSRAACIALVVAAAGCGRNAPPKAATSARPGQPGVSFRVEVQRPTMGTISSGADGRILCGPAPTATACGPVAFGWSEQVVLVATAEPGYMVGTWVGDCSGRPTNAEGQYVCVLDTSRYGADKYVGASFGPDGRVLHPNFSDPTVHGPAFMAAMARAPDSYECAYCHGSNYSGRGIALSCTDCHAAAGFPNWLATCDFCHGAPPTMRAAGGRHPDVSTNILYCFGCHPNTVDDAGHIVEGGEHMNGSVSATGGGHDPGYAASVELHGRDFFEFVSGGSVLACTGCHGSAYDLPIANGESCSSCHALAGWQTAGVPNWRTNCSFCHGTKVGTQGGYVLADHPAWAAPPDALSQRLTGVAAPDRTGAHAIHLTGSALAGPMQCSACHTVPANLGHISGRDVRAAVALQAPGQAGPPDVTGYDPVTGTCATACHGASPRRSPAWTSTGIACDGCHAVPPTTGPHAILSGGDLTVCSGCHPTTIDGSGTIIPTGTHVNGTIDSVQGHADPDPFVLSTVHGPKYLDYVAGVPSAQNCTTCHGTSLAYCGACHSQPARGGWVAWQTNCTFCHGTRTPVYTSASLNRSAPPDAVAQRLGALATTVTTRTGKHLSHLNGKAGYPSLPCGSCHAVPTSVAHVRADRRAPVVFDPASAFTTLTDAERTALPSPLAVYNTGGTTPTCTSNYCHGSTLTGGTPTAQQSPPRWSTAAGAINSCTVCHGDPPDTGRLLQADGIYCIDDCTVHYWHVQALPDYGYDSCDDCHHGSASGNSRGLHVNGKVDVVWPDDPAVLEITGDWDRGAGTCSNLSCHDNVNHDSTRSWR